MWTSSTAFGVRQRGLLAGKAQSPHLLVMSATPIPRTLGLLMYGDLDISVLDELPPGRKPIKTWFITGKKRRDMYGFLDKQIAAGHQVYIVCPAIEENEAMDSGLQAVTSRTTSEAACALLPGRRIGLLHGKMKPKDKGRCDAAVQGRASWMCLSRTTVIEVGVDVPNATVMVIENAERFGLSALHQLRGRVGRGAADSCCILISDNEQRCRAGAAAIFVPHVGWLRRGQSTTLKPAAPVISSAPPSMACRRCGWPTLCRTPAR